MISGVTGEEFPAEIFIGPVYYQRLRHMVSDKFQVRTLSPKASLVQDSATTCRAATRGLERRCVRRAA